MTDTTDPKNKIIRTLWDRIAIRDGMTVDQRRDLRKSFVRVLVTYAAAIHLFIFGPIFCWWLVTHAADTEGVTVVGIDQAKDILDLPRFDGLLVLGVDGV